MPGFNFGQIAPFISQVMDTDKMDIGRRILIEDDDGFTIEISPEEPLYIGIPCHVAFQATDNPNPTTIDTQPIITSLNVNCDLTVDIQNGDYIYAHKCDHADNILKTYMGIVGQPTVNQARQNVLMAMRQAV